MIEPGTSNGAGQSENKAPYWELLRLAELHPACSLMQVIALLDRDRWHLEELPESQKDLYSKINAVAALRLVRAEFDDFPVKFSLDSRPRTRQWLPTGRHVRVAGAMDPDTIGTLLAHCDRRLHEVGTAPLRVFDHPEVIGTPTLQAIVKTVLEALPDPLPAASDPVILKKRTLLRRTFPPSLLPPDFGNANNQHWHQDSNAQFNDSPMLTLWIPLQDGAGAIRPGLQLLDAPASYFSLEHGDSSPAIMPSLSQTFPDMRIVSVEAAAGDCIVMNGLTFHQTLVTPAMTRHRDALLVRILDRAAAHLFPFTNSDEDVQALG